MSEIDWSKAPEGATHYAPAYEKFNALWARFYDGKFEFFREFTGKWYEGAQPSSGENFIARPVEWAGTGLPPVGTVCEYYADENKWRQCEVVAHKDGYAVVWVTHAHLFTAKSSGLFRPLRTPEQIEAEERARSIQEMLEVSGAIKSPYVKSQEKYMGALYDAGWRFNGEQA